MNFGRLFKRLMNDHQEFIGLTANRCSLLSYKELRAIAKVLYPTNKKTLAKYFLKSKQELATKVYTALCNTYK